MLIKLGAEPSEVKTATRCRKGYWWLSSHLYARYALSTAWLEEQGVPSLLKLWIAFYCKDQSQS